MPRSKGEPAGSEDYSPPATRASARGEHKAGDESVGEVKRRTPASPKKAGNGSAEQSLKTLTRQGSGKGEFHIPAHRYHGSFIHRHEIPRKVFHFSIGIYTSWLYATGVQTHRFALYLLTALVPILGADILRFRSAWFNEVYMRYLGFMMRESEVKGYNGVIWFIVGSSMTCYILPKDVAVVAVICLAWCDTAASTVGRAYGKYTPKIRGNKSLAGTLAATTTGVVAAAYFWGWLKPRYGPFPDDLPNAYMFQNKLELPSMAKKLLGWKASEGIISGRLALGVLSAWTGVVAATSEAIDLWGFDDNFSIPVLCGIGLWSFLKVFG